MNESVKSINPFKSVIQTSYDVVKTHGGELKVETLPADAAAHSGKKGEGTNFIILLNTNV